jgi:cytidine deaminase
MRNVEIICRLTEYQTAGELSAPDQKLLADARQSATSAYAPYSQFNVGAAVLLENGVTIKGNNQENASYPLGLCAERVAIFAASANYPGIPIVAIAVTARSDQFGINKPVAPCGACRQAIAEYEHRFGKNIRMILSGEEGAIMTTDSIGTLLPFQFNGDDLKKKS